MLKHDATHVEDIKNRWKYESKEKDYINAYYKNLNLQIDLFAEEMAKKMKSDKKTYMG